MKTRIVGLAIAALAVAGCQTKQLDELSYTERKALGKTIAQRCIDQGITKKGPEADACLRAEVEREFATRERNREKGRHAAMAFSQGFSNYGRAMSAPAYSLSTSSHRPINCTSQSYGGGTVYTNCY